MMKLIGFMVCAVKKNSKHFLRVQQRCFQNGSVRHLGTH